MVRRIPADANSHHPHYPNGEGSFSGKSRQHGPHCNIGDHLRYRRRIALHAYWASVKVHAIAAALLARPRWSPVELRTTNPGRQSLVCPSLGHVIRDMKNLT